MTKPTVNVWGSSAVISPLTAQQQAQGYAYTATKPGQLSGIVETDDLDYPMRQVTEALDWLLTDDTWKSIPVGVPFPLRSDIGAPEPSNVSDEFKFIKLTYNDAYNAGLLTSEVISGAAPAVLSSGIINVPSSPMNGQTVRLINTMSAIIRPSTTAAVVLGDAIRNITGSVSLADQSFPNRIRNFAFHAGAFKSIESLETGEAFKTKTIGTQYPEQKSDLVMDASLQVPTSIENRQYSESAVYYMRVL